MAASAVVAVDFGLIVATETLVRIVAPGFVAGAVFVAGRCTEAAPILRRWLAGKTEDEARAVIARKGWRATIVQPQHQQI